MFFKRTIFIAVVLSTCILNAQQPDQKLWHNKERVVHYLPQGNDFVLKEGKRRFNRALYGTNTGFRIEAGDLPEFALYMPGMGGNFKFGLIAGNKSKWLIDADHIKTIYRPGSMIYEINDPLLGKGMMRVIVLALADKEGMIIKTETTGITGTIELVVVFGGASGKKFSRDGDIGADPESSFYLHPENCTDNSYQLNQNSFHLYYGTGKVLTEEQRYEVQHLPDSSKNNTATKNLKQLAGLFPPAITLKLSDASQQQDPGQLYGSKNNKAPVVTGKLAIGNGANYFLIQNAVTPITQYYTLLPDYFNKAESARKKLAERIIVNTPDKYINTLGGTLSVAADAIWEDPSYLHGAVAWRMRLNAWRGAYVADPLGWHDRARKHFDSYALSQITTPPSTGIVMDTALHLARHLEKVGTALFSDGYICRNPNGDIRAHHYDMNLVFVDQLLNHFNWTGDTAYVKKMWPLLKRHLAWEKRNFDADGDGLYDAYAAIWASDALQYSGGGVTHSSAYNYRANKTAAQLAALIGEDGTIYKQEANKIIAAIEKNLWLPEQGSYAEYKDLLGNKLVHPSPGLWTIYHVIDSKVPDPFKAYLNLRYIDLNIPHIPVAAKGWEENDLYLLSTTNWQPYTWSINNVALGENLHTSLAYWQGNRPQDAFKLWRSTLLESMYLSASPGGFQQLSFYDAIRGELYRDFADGIGMAGRSLVEGMFGIQPDALHDSLLIQPGYPATWPFASLTIPDITYSFKRSGNTETYKITNSFKKKLALRLVIPADKEDVRSVTVNGKPAKWKVVTESVGVPRIEIIAAYSKNYVITVAWSGRGVSEMSMETDRFGYEEVNINAGDTKAIRLYDPMHLVKEHSTDDGKMNIKLIDPLKKGTVFILMQKGKMSWWAPCYINPRTGSYNSTKDIPLTIKTSVDSVTKIDLSSYFNDKVTNIFKHQYLSPRPASPTLQLPTQGIGNWCYPLATANIDDRGLRKAAGENNEIRNIKIPFATPGDSLLNNIVFTSKWDNFPDSVTIPVNKKATILHLLMTGTTNPMQSHVVNGMIVAKYTDQTSDTLLLKNPGNWYPIEQDYYIDGFAFPGDPGRKPWRLYLKEGKFGNTTSYTSIKGFSNMAIDGGAATVLQMYPNRDKTISSLNVHAVANDVVIGLMAVTIER
ncbi:MAG TPA: DUF4450 domain-containing protein [Chitinophagaceae bacterium]|nr:DUF4450 domain-containing protein [Chitinophagaceae bacterium]